MKKNLSTLTSFNFTLFVGFNMVACINHDDDLENSPSEQSIKSDLQVAKQFLLTNHLTIDTIFAKESAQKYIDYLKVKHQDQIKNEINFLFTENEFEELENGEQQVLAILNHHNENETVNVKFTILSDIQVANNILNQAEKKLQESIKAFGLLATSSLNQATIDKIINLVTNQINNINVQVTWIDNSSLKTLESNKVNQAQVELSIKNENDSLLASKIVDITLVDVSDSLEIVNQKLLDTAEQKLLSVDGEGLTENEDLSSYNLRQEITNLLQTILSNPQINISLLNDSKTLKENNNEVKIRLTILQEEHLKPVEREITVSFSNIISSQKYDNIIYLKDKLPNILKSVDGSKLPSDFSVNNSEIWQLINDTINDPNVKAFAPPILKKNTVTVQEQLHIVSNNFRFGRLFGRTRNFTSKTVSKPKIVKSKIPTKRIVKTKKKVKKSISVDAKKNSNQKKDNVKTKNESSSDKQSQKDSSQQIDKTDQMEHYQEKIEQANELSQSFINQLIYTNISAKLNDYNIFALVTVGIGENAVTDIVPVKFINVV